MTQPRFAPLAHLVIAILFLLCLAGAGPLSPSTTPPNIILLVWDTVRADHLGVYGYHRPTTPNLDHFAQEARVYENAITPVPWTLPAFAAIFTGFYQHTTRANIDHLQLDDHFQTVAELLRQSGYSCYLFSCNGFIDQRTHMNQGFDVMETPSQPQWHQEVEKIVATWRQRFPFLATESTELPDNTEQTTSLQGVGNNFGEIANQSFAAWLAKRDRGKPFFAVFNFMEAHSPRIRTREEMAQFLSPAQIEPAIQQFHPEFRRKIDKIGRFSGITPADLEVLQGVYDTSIRRLDQLFAEWLRMVEAMAPRAETVIIVTADHGEGLGEHELLDHRSSVYQTLLAVPCIIRYPARFPVGRTKLPINLIDLFPTMLDLAGISTASIPKGIAGYSLCDAEKQVPRSRALISERLPIRPHNPAEDFGLQAPPLPAEAGFPLLRTIIKDGQKLIWRDDQTMELYQLSNDRAESTNLIQGSMLTAKALLAELDLWVKTSGAEQLPNPTMPPPLPADPHLLQEIKALGYIRP